MCLWRKKGFRVIRMAVQSSSSTTSCFGRMTRTYFSHKPQDGGRPEPEVHPECREDRPPDELHVEADSHFNPEWVIFGVASDTFFGR